jgi:signal transduction histidine kinase
MQGTLKVKGARVTIDALPSAWGDPTAVEQVFANLVANAVNYLDPTRPGDIEIGTQPTPIGVESLRIYYVRDNGLGIPASALPRLFNAFQRLHGNIAKGEGIGLALVRRVVERHGGHVWVESSEGRGSTFYVSLPASAAARAALRVAAANAFASRCHGGLDAVLAEAASGAPSLARSSGSQADAFSPGGASAASA